MSHLQDIHIPNEIVTQAQIEGANYVRAIEGLLSDMRSINQYSKLLPYLRRFYYLHKRIYPRVMLILAGVTDFDNADEREGFFEYQAEFLQERKQLVKAIALLRSTRISAQLLVMYKETDWYQAIYSMAHDIFEDWRIGDDNRLYFSSLGEK